MSVWFDNGLKAFTVGLQGGCPYCYCDRHPQFWIVSAWNELGSLNMNYFERLRAVLQRADELGMVVIVQFFYAAQVSRFTNQEAALAGADNAVDWLLQSGYKNFVLEIANECNFFPSTFPQFLPYNIAGIIERIHNRSSIAGHRLLVSASLGGGSIPDDSLISNADFVLLHGNGQTPANIAKMIAAVRESTAFRLKPKPIIFNEDDHTDFDKPENNMKSAISLHVSWGFLACCNDTTAGDYFDGYQCPPTNWGINTIAKVSFFSAAKNYTK